MTSVFKSPIARSLLSALAGFIAYGLWAYYANHEHGHAEALKSACVQGSFSFTITLIINGVMEFLYAKLKHTAAPKLITATVACVILYSASYGVNYVAGTMNIIKTILPGAIASTFYIAGYIKAISALDKS